MQEATCEAALGESKKNGGKPMDNKGRFKVGTQFIGNVNKVPMEVVKIEDRLAGTSDEGRYPDSKVATIKNLLDGRTFRYGLRALEKCNVAIVN